MATQPAITIAAAQSMMTALETAIDAGTAAVINIYSGTVPTDADTALGAQVLLAQLVCSATFGTVGTSGNNARITAGSIANDSSADATGTASFFRILTQSAGTVVVQGTVGTSAADLVLNTTAITLGSTVSITAATLDLPKI